MRKIIPLAGIIILAAIAILWSKSSSDRSPIVTKVEATEVPATISPMDLMVKRGNTLPIEYPTDPF